MSEKITINELLEELDDSGLIITDPDEIEITLEHLGINPDMVIVY